MKALRFRSFFVPALVLVAAASAADVTGKWVAQVPAQGGGTREVVFNLKANGSQLTGTVSTPMGERAISEGKVEGDKISFAVVVEYNRSRTKFLYTGKVAGSELKFSRQLDGGEEGAREFTAKRRS